MTKPHNIRVLLADENKGFGGAERHVLTLANELVELDILEALVARPKSWLAKNVGDIPFHPVGFRNEVDMLSVYSIYRRLKSSEANVLHCIGHRDLVASALARQLPGAPPTALLKAEHSYPDSNLSPLFRWAYGQCQAITAVSESLLQAVKEAVGPQDSTLLATVHNGIEIGGEIVAPAAADGRPLHIGVLSPMRPGKGHTDFLKAARKLQEVHGDVRFSMAGDGELEASLKNQAEDAGLEIEFLGHLDEPIEYLNSLDLSVIPSHRETFSLVTLETMFCGRPIVAAESDGVKEVCRDYPAQLYPVGDVEALTQAMVDFCADPGKFQSEAVAAAERARQEFSSRQMAGSYSDVYKQILGSR
ncbi:MAG: glycosyltransferase family 4 protein [Candidatus Eremiobacteraeota bacterium]|nr:glycosyltransferase family 4 protein [Candidatus Eremiobacteraeota bacterium]